MKESSVAAGLRALLDECVEKCWGLLKGMKLKGMKHLRNEQHDGADLERGCCQ